MSEDAVAQAKIQGLDFRVTACEGECRRLSSDMADCKDHEATLRGKLWDKLNKLEVDVARSSVKVALLVGTVAAVAGAVLSAALQIWLK